MFKVLDEGSYTESNETDRAVLISAIEGRRYIEFSYNGFQRFAEPYELGKTKDGNTLLRAYQLGGEAFTDKIEGWKLFRLDYITSLGLANESFDPRLDYFTLPQFWTYDPIITIKGG